MKNDSSIILEQLIKLTLIEQTGLVHDPVNKKKQSSEDKGTPGNAQQFDLSDMVFWGYVITSVLSFFGLRYGFKKGFGSLFTGKFIKDGWKRFKRMNAASMLRLYRGMENPRNIMLFEKWAAQHTDIRVIVPKGSNLVELATKYKADAWEIWEANKNGVFKGMSYGDVGKRQINNVLIKREMTVKEREAIFKILRDPERLYFIRRDIFKEAFKQFKNGETTAKEFIKNLSPQNAKKLGPTLRRMERNRASNVTITYRPNP
jgi:hypothetical protein